METVQRKLIEENAAIDNSLSLMPEEVTDPILLGLVGIASGQSPAGEPADDRLDYILSKLHDFQKIADPDNVLGTAGPEIITPAEFISRYL